MNAEEFICPKQVNYTVQATYLSPSQERLKHLHKFLIVRGHCCDRLLKEVVLGENLPVCTGEVDLQALDCLY